MTAGHWRATSLGVWDLRAGVGALLGNRDGSNARAFFSPSSLLGVLLSGASNRSVPGAHSLILMLL